MNRREFCEWAVAVAGAAAWPKALAQTQGVRTSLSLMDMVHFNPGEPAPATKFLDPGYLHLHGFSAQVVQSPIEGTALFASVASGLIAPGSPEHAWAERTRAAIQERIRTAHVAGLAVYAWMQMVVLPKAVLAHFRDEICDAEGHIDVELPRTQQLIAVQLQEVLETYPLLDGLIIRTGEVYLQDLPFHASSGGAAGTAAIQQSTAILRGSMSHLALLRLLREEVCVRHGRKVFYRTWDFNHFHTDPAYYLDVTDRIAPHANLFFSVKHQAGDFHQLIPFNPTLGIGRHPQLVEVQCQREAYGKGAHPYYIGKGVIDGWEDMRWINPPGRAKGLRELLPAPQFAGVWTWSRGGGWEGPYIKNELWCTLNAFVMSEWVRRPSLTELEAFLRAAHAMGVPATEQQRFHTINLLSAQAVLRGQLTAIPSKYNDPIQIDLWWARDDKLDNPDLSDFVRRGLVERSIAEKDQAVGMWRQIVKLADVTTLGTPQDTSYMRSSCRYGLMKYSVIAEGWTAVLLAQAAALQNTMLDPRVATAVRRWDELWGRWKAMAVADPLMSTLVRPQAFDIDFKYRPGLGAAIDALRGHVASGEKKTAS